MPTCEKCDNKWSWKQTVKKTSALYPDMICPYCGETQYQTKSRYQILFSIAIMFLPLLLSFFFDIPRVFLLSLLPVLFIVVMVTYPLWVKLSSEEPYT